MLEQPVRQRAMQRLTVLGLPPVSLSHPGCGFRGGSGPHPLTPAPLGDCRRSRSNPASRRGAGGLDAAGHAAARRHPRDRSANRPTQPVQVPSLRCTATAISLGPRSNDTRPPPTGCRQVGFPSHTNCMRYVSRPSMTVRTIRADSTLPAAIIASICPSSVCCSLPRRPDCAAAAIGITNPAPHCSPTSRPASSVFGRSAPWPSFADNECSPRDPGLPGFPPTAQVPLIHRFVTLAHPGSESLARADAHAPTTGAAPKQTTAPQRH